MATIIVPRSQASLNAAMRSGLCGALPAPKVSSTTPCKGGDKNARTAAAVMLGKRRKQAKCMRLSDKKVQRCEWPYTYIFAHDFKTTSISATLRETIMLTTYPYASEKESHLYSVKRYSS
jgi:hypothetical protein